MRVPTRSADWVTQGQGGRCTSPRLKFPALLRAANELILFPQKNALFPHNRFSTHFFSMKMAEF